MDFEKEAKKIKEEDRHKATIDYIEKATKNQKEAGEQMNTLIDNAKDAFNEILEASLGNEGFTDITHIVNRVNSLLNDTKNGGNIEDIIKQIESLK